MNLKFYALLTLSLILGACSHFTAHRDEVPTQQPGHTYKYHSFLFGFIPGPQLASSEILCPQSRIQTLDYRMSSLDVLITSATVGIYVPHRVTVTCANP